MAVWSALTAAFWAALFIAGAVARMACTSARSPALAATSRAASSSPKPGGGVWASRERIWLGLDRSFRTGRRGCAARALP